MPNKNYRRGYALERYCELTLLYNGYHVKRNALSVGVEDIVAFDDHGNVLLVQCKNTKKGAKSMNMDEMEILGRHAFDIKATPIFLYKEGFNKYVWWDVNTCTKTNLIKKERYTKEWYRDRMNWRKKLRSMKNESMTNYNKYVLQNWDTVKDFIC